MTLRRAFLIGSAVMIAALIAAAAFGRSGVLKLRDLSGADVVQLLTPLFLLSLFIERALEVFLTAWRQPTRVLLCADPSKKDELKRYEVETLRLSLTAAALLGVVVASVGFRVLDQIIATDALAVVTGTQRAAFRGLDVLLSGALLGGGASALHGVVSLFTDFVDATRNRLPAPSPEQERAT